MNGDENQDKDRDESARHYAWELARDGSMREVRSALAGIQQRIRRRDGDMVYLRMVEAHLMQMENARRGRDADGNWLHSPGT